MCCQCQKGGRRSSAQLFCAVSTFCDLASLNIGAPNLLSLTCSRMVEMVSWQSLFHCSCQWTPHNLTNTAGLSSPWSEEWQAPPEIEEAFPLQLQGWPLLLCKWGDLKWLQLVRACGVHWKLKAGPVAILILVCMKCWRPNSFDVHRPFVVTVQSPTYCMHWSMICFV